ncbi:MauE/DoxX family redox-associated membrane protein [Spirillospora sp. NPDC048911]|uniref:MauE/DoxX family redox-associated membrane protein n=1 Tax=Spirillospora sp. NPDC048911 TaxID=3364527 RepID=UPI0037172858
MLTNAALGCEVLIALVFCVSSASKVWTRRYFADFVASVQAVRILPQRWAVRTAALVVVAEGAIPALLVTSLLAGVSPRFREYAVTLRIAGTASACVLLLAFTVLIVFSGKRRIQVACRCLGAGQGSPMGRRHIVRNIVLLAAASSALMHELIHPIAGVDAAAALSTCALAGVAVLLIVRLDDMAEFFAPQR